MSGVTLSVSSVEIPGIINRLKRAKGTVNTELTRTLNASIAQARRTVPAGTPVRTGTAQRGWATRQTGALERELYNDVLYIPFLVLGTRYMGASAMLNRALDKAAKDMDKTLTAIGSRLEPILSKDY